jgi:hypothetical protein
MNFWRSKQDFQSHLLATASRSRRYGHLAINFLVVLSSAMLISSDNIATAKEITLVVLAGQSNAAGAGSFSSKEPDAFDPNAPFWVPAAADNAVLFSFRGNNRGINFSGNPDVTSGTSPSLRMGLVGQTQVPPNDSPNRFPDVFIGSEVGIARGLYDPVLSPDVAIVKVAYGGTAIASWQKGSSAGFFSALQNRVNAAKSELQGLGYTNVNVDGFFWQQGESDASSSSNANAYQSRLQTLLNDFRTDIGDSNTKVVLGGILNSFTFSSTINGAMQAIDVADPKTQWFPTSDLPLANTADQIHFNYNGILEMGNRFATNYNILSIPEPSTWGFVAIFIAAMAMLYRIKGMRHRRGFEGS